jgi:ABC-type multidrug transport system fused ATPase/permease subunit
LNIAGFCVMVIAAWATRTAGAIGLVTWGIGGVLIALRMPDDCRQFMTVALVNTLVALPVIVTVTYAGTAAYERSRRRAMEIRQQEIRESSRATAAIDINAALHDVVQEAVSLISAIANGAEVDSEMRERLRLVDGQIRADMQVDPQGAGAFAVLAKSLVDALAERGVITTVKGINSSTDHRPIDEAALNVVYRLLSAIATRSGVQVITNGQEDFLSMSVDPQTLAVAGLKPGTTSTFGDCMIDVDLDEVTEGRAPTATVVLSRSVEQ